MSIPIPAMAPMTPALLRQFRRSLEGGLAAAAAWPGQGLLLALSGGSDSVALLHLTMSVADDLGVPVAAAHLDHGLRGAESRQDVEFCRCLADRYRIPLVTDTVDTRAYAGAGKLSLEDAGRRLRRSFLKRVAATQGSRVVLLGHTIDDQAETLLLNLLRGAGPRGLGAMQAAGPRPFLRPVLGFEREALRQWLSSGGFEWRDDASNADTTFTRNRIRHELMPLLKAKFNPQATKALVRTATLQYEIDHLLRRLAAAHLGRHARIDVEGGRVVLDRAALLAEPVALQRMILRAAGETIAPERLTWGQVHLEGVLGGLIQRGEARWVFPSGMVMVRSGDELIIERPRTKDQVDSPVPEPIEVPIEPGTEVTWGGGHLRVTRLEAGAVPWGALQHDSGRRAALFNADGLGSRLLLRAARVGERMTLFGGGHHRKISDILIDARVPLGARRIVPVLAEPIPGEAGASSDEAVWLIGVARSAVSPVTEVTRRVIHLEWFGELPGVARKTLKR